MKKFKKFFSKLFYGIFNGLKSAEDEILKTKTSQVVESNYIEQIQEQNLGSDLLRGEVTQEVKDLRYSTYEVYKESNNYEYIGNGISIKNKEHEKNLNKINFIQRNHKITKSVLESFSDEIWNDNFTLTFSYNDINRFKLERYVEYVIISTSYQNAIVQLKFNKNYDVLTPITRMFYNELMKLSQNNSNNEIFQNIKSLCFTTYKANGEDDFVMYLFNNLKPISVEIEENYVIVSFQTNDFSRTDLSEKFFSKNQQIRYEKKEPRKKNDKIITYSNNYICSKCGCEMNRYDYEITSHQFNYSICPKCLEKDLTLLK